jgi:GntR family transcriptional repressor for pyruvate dehydrogenase complex
MKDEIRETEAALPSSGRTTGGLANRVYDQLLARINSGEFAAQTRLPSENEIAKNLDVSRPIVRDALARLREEGLVYSKQGAGTFVRSKTEYKVLAFAPVETVADIQRCYEFRLAIEPFAARYAALRRDTAAILKIEEALASLEEATRKQNHSEGADYAFHLSVSQAANNHYYTSAMQALRDHIGIGMRLHGISLMGPKPELSDVYKEHERIFRMIETGNAELAEDSMRKHLEGSRDRLFEGHHLDLKF